MGGGLSDAESEKGRETLPPGRKMGKGKDRGDGRLSDPRGTELACGGEGRGLEVWTYSSFKAAYLGTETLESQF